MQGRFLTFIVMMLLGVVFSQVYLYHPIIAREHYVLATIPLVVSALAMSAGFLLLAADCKLTATLFALCCMAAIVVGAAGVVIHAATPAPTLSRLVNDLMTWRSLPPVLVPLSFAAAGCLGLFTVILPGQRRLEQQPVAIARLLTASAALFALAAAVAAVLPQDGTLALFGVIAALGFGALGFVAEITAIACASAREQER